MEVRKQVKKRKRRGKRNRWEKEADGGKKQIKERSKWRKETCGRKE
jgi:hypothetical protein